MSTPSRTPDYSTWLTPERLAHEEFLWSDPTLRTWPVFVEAIDRVRNAHGLYIVKEFGCGTGWVPQALPDTVKYLGVDANAGCIARAKLRNPGQQREFVLADLRAFSIAYYVGPYDSTLVCAFSVLKHFGLDEWGDVVCAVLRHGVRGLFSIPMGGETKDDGTEFPHVQVTREFLESNIGDHVIVRTDPLPWGETMVETVREGWE